MKSSFKLKSLVVAIAAIGVWGCSTKQIAKNSANAEYDDLYAQIGESGYTEVAYASNDELNSEIVTGERAYKETEAQSAENEYFPENGIDSRDYRRNPSTQPGLYADDYVDGYRDAMYDQRFNWGNSWNNSLYGFNRFNYNNWYSPGVSIVFGNRFNRWNNFGFYDPFYTFNSPWNFYSPWGGYNSWAYDPFYSPYGFNNYYSFNNYYWGGNNYVNYNRYNNRVLGADRTDRNYGPRATGRSVAGFNDAFENKAKPRYTGEPAAKKGTVYNDPSNAGYGGGGVYTARPRGGYSGSANTSTSANTNTSRGATTYDSGTSRVPSARTDASGTKATGSSNDGFTRRERATSNSNSGSDVYYARPRSYSAPSNTGGYSESTNSRRGSFDSGASRSYDSGSSSRSYDSGSSRSYNSGSSSSSWGGSSSSSSSGSSSRGSSGGSSGGSSSGGGGGSRGPR